MPLTKDHPLLSPAAIALDAEAFEAHARVAEAVLGLSGADLSDADALMALDAVALQVNFQVDVLPDRDWGSVVREDPFYYQDKDTWANPVALRMAKRLVGSGNRPSAAFRPHPRTPVITSAQAVAERDAAQEVKRRPFEIRIT